MWTRPPATAGAAVPDTNPVVDLFSRRAIFLDELRQVGAVFSYPDALTPGEWAGLLALGRARAKLDVEAKGENLAPDDLRIRQTREAQKQALIAKTGRRG